MKTQIRKQHTNVVAVQPLTTFHREDRMKNAHPTLFASQGTRPHSTSSQGASVHRFSTIVATSILLLGSICSAQQASVPSDKASGTSVNASSIAGNPGDSASPGPLSATNSYIPYFQNPVTGYTDSIMNQPNSTQISTAGNFGLSSYSYSYGIGGISVLSANHNYGTYNLSVGAQACSATNGSQNDVCVGDGAGQNIASNGKVNTFVGFRAGQLSTSGGWNVCVGAGACLYNGGATGNTSIGTYSGFNTTGSSNTFLGTGAGGSVTTGSSNIYIGPNAGNPSSPGESNTIRIGVNGAGSGTAEQSLHRAAGKRPQL